MDTIEINKDNNAPWDTTGNIMAYFNRAEKGVKQLDWANIASNKIELLHQALYTFKESGDLEQALLNWYALPELDEIWAKAK